MSAPCRHAATAALLAALAGCGPGLPSWEQRWMDLRSLRDAVEVAEARGLDRLDDGRTLDAARARVDEIAAGLRRDMPRAHGEEESRALAVMRESLPARERPAPAGGAPDLRAETYARFGRAASHVTVDGEVLDRLTILGRLATEPSPERRQRLFLALQPVWQAMSGGGAYRALAAGEAERWVAGRSPAERAARALGVDPARLEPMLVAVLERWRDTMALPAEPWDYWYLGGEAARQLAPLVRRDQLEALNARYHRDLGADLGSLGVRWDLEPREGKTPVAFTTFGRRWPRPEAWVFATYREGGFDNLSELLHETGHAVHVSAIRTRPAFTDWPDSDTYTEALGDLLAAEAWEPEWQQRYLGASVPASVARRGRHAPVMLDICWALFEWRVHQDPSADPDRVWTELTSRYLGIKPHPELSWWAMRGQLVDAPGYMTNYALGAILVADLRARAREQRGPFAPDPSWYPWLSERLYRFGRERDSRGVVRDFLGRGPTADALLAELPAPPPR